MPDTQTLQQMAARFAPTDMTADLSALSDSDRRVVAKLVQASKIVDGLFLRQVWAGNDAMLADLARDQSSEGRARLHYFLINKGPWSRIDHNAPFVPGAPAKPAGANYYPAGASKADLERWIQSLPEAERARATGFFTVVRRAGNSFTLVPYNVEYQGELVQAASFLREAAQLTGQPTLKAFLNKRADAFLSNDYYESDVAWMELEGAIEPTIGPYEVYEDELFNYKAGFEAYVTVQDPVETAKLQKLAAELQDIEDHLPIDPKQRNPKLGALAPITVVNEVYASGDGNRGVQTAAFNLPNDERVVREKGTKRVMLKNVQDAKFAKTLLPISKIVLPPARPGAPQHHGQRPQDHRAPGAERDLQRARGSQGRHFRALRDTAHDRQGRDAQIARSVALHDVSGVRVPFDSLWRERSARAWHRHPVELPDRSARLRHQR